MSIRGVQSLGWIFLFFGDEILPSYMGIILSYYKDPYKQIRIQWHVIRVLNIAHMFFFEHVVTVFR